MRSDSGGWGDDVWLRTRGLPRVGGGGRGTLNNDPWSESGPEEVALDTGVGLRIVKETLEDMVSYQESVLFTLDYVRNLNLYIYGNDISSHRRHRTRGRLTRLTLASSFLTTWAPTQRMRKSVSKSCSL